MAVDGELAEPAAAGFEEALGLDEHAAGAAAGVVNPTLDLARRVGEGFQQPDPHPHHRAGGVELAAARVFGTGEQAEEIFVDPAENVLRLTRLHAQGNTGWGGGQAYSLGSPP